MAGTLAGFRSQTAVRKHKGVSKARWVDRKTALVRESVDVVCGLAKCTNNANNDE